MKLQKKEARSTNDLQFLQLCNVNILYFLALFRRLSSASNESELSSQSSHSENCANEVRGGKSQNQQGSSLNLALVDNSVRYILRHRIKMLHIYLLIFQVFSANPLTKSYNQTMGIDRMRSIQTAEKMQYNEV